MGKLHKLHIQGFKSIRDQELEFGSLNVFIGGNGAGKSNLIGIFHFLHLHDTSVSAPMKQTSNIADNRFLRADASNLAAFLYRLQEKQEVYYRNIEETLQQVAPFFNGFKLAPSVLNPDKIRLEWEEKGSDTYFSAAALSDGTLRFICLSTLLLQPELPSLILIDEPELGLHPAAIQVLAGLLESAATRTQIIVATSRSRLLINCVQSRYGSLNVKKARVCSGTLRWRICLHGLRITASVNSGRRISWEDGPDEASSDPCGRANRGALYKGRTSWPPLDTGNRRGPKSGHNEARKERH